jgi:hypothetical protein
MRPMPFSASRGKIPPRAPRVSGRRRSIQGLGQSVDLPAYAGYLAANAAAPSGTMANWCQGNGWWASLVNYINPAGCVGAITQQAAAQIVQAATSPATGDVNQPLVQYETQGGAPPASVLAVDPNAQSIPSLSALAGTAYNQGLSGPPTSSGSWLIFALLAIAGLTVVWSFTQ